MIIGAYVTSFLCIIYVAGVAQTPFYNLQYKNWNGDSITGNVKHTVYLIGDAGEVNPSKPSGLKLLKAHLKKETQASTVVFLGDNSYPRGLSEKNSSKREHGEINLRRQLEILKDYRGNSYFIPGNHDWDHWSKKGWEGIKREEEFIERELNRGNTFLPDQGCPGPVEVPLNEHVLLVIIDTQWWLHKWTKPIGEESTCFVASEFDFVERLTLILKNNRDKQILIVAHHPVFSNGSHGGFYSFKEHVFPLTGLSPVLYIPLPVVGSIYPLARKYFPPIQDIKHNRYQGLKHNLVEAFKGHTNLIFATGHEHSLQYFNKDQHYIVSGSGSKSSYVAKKKGAAFTYSNQGFTKVIYLQSGEVWIEFWATTPSNESGALIFRTKIKNKD